MPKKLIIIILTATCSAIGAAEAPAQKQTSDIKVLQMLGVATDSKDLKKIIFDYLDYDWWEEVKTLAGHNGKVTLVAYSRDGRYLASRSEDGNVIIWDVATGKFINAFKEQRDKPHHYPPIEVTRDGYRQTYLDNTTKIVWDYTTESGFKSHHMIQAGYIDVYSVSWWYYPYYSHSLYSPDGKHMVYQSYTNKGTIKINELTICGHCSGALAWSQDSKQLAFGLQDKTIGILDIESNQVTTLTGHADSVTSVAFSADGNYLASGAEDGTIKIWQKKNRDREIKLANSLKSDKDKAVSSPEISTQRTVPAASAPASIRPTQTNRPRESGTCTIM